MEGKVLDDKGARADVKTRTRGRAMTIVVDASRAARYFNIVLPKS